MTSIAARVCYASHERPDATSEEIAALVGTRPEYVRTVWQRQGILRARGRRGKYDGALRLALEQLFLAITEEGRDVEAAINFAERTLYGNGGGTA